jgi:hypothetical protein
MCEIKVYDPNKFFEGITVVDNEYVRVIDVELVGRYNCEVRYHSGYGDDTESDMSFWFCHRDNILDIDNMSRLETYLEAEPLDCLITYARYYIRIVMLKQLIETKTTILHLTA